MKRFAILPPTVKTFPVLLLIFGLLLSSCSRGREEYKPVDLVTFELRGTVVSIDTSTSTVNIAHDEIPNYMMAMTMPFKVKDPALLARMSAGDSIVATLAVSRRESWLETISVAGKGNGVRALSSAEVLSKKEFRIGHPLPNVDLVNQSGEPFTIKKLTGKSVAITFIYTRCPIPDYCIRMSNYFAEVQRSMANEKSVSGKWHLLTISFDPTYDTPAVLNRYATSYNADFINWTFATGEASVIHQLAEGVGLSFDMASGQFDHNLRTLLLDRNGDLVKVIRGNEWTPDEVSVELLRLATK